MDLAGSLWNRETKVRLQRIHDRVAYQAISGEPSARHPLPQFRRRRTGVIHEAITAVLAEHKDGLRLWESGSASQTRLRPSNPPFRATR